MEKTSVNNEPEESLSDKISLMMYGFGDSSTPNPETVKLVESLLRKQILEMLANITSTNTAKSYNIIRTEDIIFYLRKNKQKVLKQQMDTGSKKLADSVKQFIDLIDETGELSDTSFDAVKHSRMLRAERISSALDDEKYLEYAKARNTSFIHEKTKSDTAKFKKWIDPQNEFHLRCGAVEIISFLAYGIVANVTDMALIIRENSSYQTSDPLRMKIGHYHNSMMFNVPHITKNNVANKGQLPITVDEVHEVIRRCYMPQIGYMRFSNKSILGKRKLCY